MLTRTLRSIVTDHYLLGSITASVPYGLTKWEEGPANNLWPIGLGRYARHALGIISGETYREPL